MNSFLVDGKAKIGIQIEFGLKIIEPRVAKPDIIKFDIVKPNIAKSDIIEPSIVEFNKTKLNILTSLEGWSSLPKVVKPS